MQCIANECGVVVCVRVVRRVCATESIICLRAHTSLVY